MATRKSGLTPLWKKSDINRLFKKVGEHADMVIYQILQRTGEEFVKVARLSGQYIDHTGNLRSSIGYVIAKDGKILGKDFKASESIGTDKETGKREAEQLAIDLVRTYNNGYVLIAVAGMKYAVFVEAMENKDVVSLAASKSVEFIRKQSASLFNRLGL